MTNVLDFLIGDFVDSETAKGEFGKEGKAIQDSIINKLYYIVCRSTEDHPPIVPC
jgi:hypothetical protein